MLIVLCSVRGIVTSCPVLPGVEGIISLAQSCSNTDIKCGLRECLNTIIKDLSTVIHCDFCEIRPLEADC
jgi:hypothetical protein